jgi:cell division protein FtsX
MLTFETAVMLACALLLFGGLHSVASAVRRVADVVHAASQRDAEQQASHRVNRGDMPEERFQTSIAAE